MLHSFLLRATIGNGWIKIINLGRYAVTLYDKHTGEGVRVSVCPEKLDKYEAFKTWLYKLKPKFEQDTPQLQRDIAIAGASVCTIECVKVKPSAMKKRSKGGIADCPICHEPYPVPHGAICRGCQGESPYEKEGIECTGVTTSVPAAVKSVAIEDAIGEKALHDMTGIEPGESKAPVFKKGHTFDVDDLCQLQRIGKNEVYVTEGDIGDEWVHENECARNFSNAMSGENVVPQDEACEGKIDMIAQITGLLHVDVKRLEAFNHIPGVTAACRKNYSIVSKGVHIAGTRAIPLYLPRTDFDRAMQILQDAPIFEIKPLRKAKAGVLITGNEIFDGVIQDRFEDIIQAKLAAFGSEIKKTIIAPDDREQIATAVKELVDAGCDLIITTAGLSVDPTDVTRLGLMDAGLEDILYGTAILPGAMTLIGKLKGIQVLGVPACALFHKITSFDLILPRLLANLEITRSDLAEFANGGMCMDCVHCTFPKCSFGR